MPLQHSGFCIHFDEARRSELIREHADSTIGSFTDALSVSDWEIGRLCVALISFSGQTVDFLAVAKKGDRVVTGKNRIEFSNLLNVEEIPYAEINQGLLETLQRYFILASQGSGRVIPPVTWQSTVSLLKKARPHLAAAIERIESLSRYSGIRFFGSTSELMIQEREALGIALDIFSGSGQLREQVLREWAPSESNVEGVSQSNMQGTLGPAPISFLDGLPSRMMQEESALQHDLFNWPQMTPTHSSGRSVFQQGERTLEVVYANRNALERTLGVDLIYFNQRFGSFVLVQYKMMQQETDEFVYRPDAQLHEELGRMNDFQVKYPTDSAITSHEQFRLSPDGFFVKMVPNKGIPSASGELIKGMYLARDYMNFLVGSEGPTGPRGGSLISFKGAPRYLTNSQFSEMVSSGLLGSRSNQSSIISHLIRSYYETGRALLVAREISDEQPRAN
jgi:hypothetical protein